MKAIISTTALLFGFALPLVAQQAKPAAPQLVDRIVAVVGDTVLLNSDIDEQLEYLRAQGQPIPKDSAALTSLRRQLLDQLVESLVILQAAQRDTSLTVDETKVNAEVERQMNDRKNRIGSQAAFEQALAAQHLTLNEWRELLAADVRKEMLRRAFLSKRIQLRKAPPISEKDLHEKFEKEKEQLPDRPATVSFTQVVLPGSTETERAAARQKADSILQAIKAGEDFATLAKKYSDDTGTKENGGDLGWSKPSAWVTEFAAALMRLRPGMVSPVTETPYGFHIIKLEKERAGEKQARHILIKPATSDAGVQEVTARATKIADQIKAGADIDSIAKAIGDPGERVRLGPLAVEQLAQEQPTYAEKLKDAKTGDVVGPFRIGGGENGAPEKVIVLKVTDARPAGKYSWDDPAFREQYRSSVQQNALVAEIIGELKKQTFIEIRS